MVTKQRLMMSNILLGSAIFILAIIGGGLMGWLPKILPSGPFAIFSLLLLVVAGRIRWAASKPPG